PGTPGAFRLPASPPPPVSRMFFSVFALGALQFRRKGHPKAKTFCFGEPRRLNRVGAASAGLHKEKNMEPVNGTIEPKSFLNGVNGKAPEAEKKISGGEPVAKSFTNGRILTRVWAELMVWGEIRWRVSQIRTGSDSRDP